MVNGVDEMQGRVSYAAAPLDGASHPARGDSWGAHPAVIPATFVRNVLQALQAHAPEVIAIGASAGALDALGRLLPELPPSFPAPILLVVHMLPDGESRLPSVLAAHCELDVCQAEDKMEVRGGRLYVAPPDYHLLLERQKVLALSSDCLVNYSRPSIDVLFESVAYACGRRSLGILLSGASADGAAGLALIRAHGGLTWVQTPGSASMSAMPDAALTLAPHVVMEPSDMGRALATWCRRPL
jgi:two-component system, chemotaxis family, protein-glutamate methylesterase/glutaminase